MAEAVRTSPWCRSARARSRWVLAEGPSLSW